jgi:Cu(I)/Ag(I) efflux system membrane fusion protein
LVRISDNYHLRLDFPVEVGYVKEVHVGDPVDIRVGSLNGKVISGNITRTTDRVTEDTRTMITEIEVANADLELIPGMYATAIFRFQRRPHVLSIPITTVAGETNKTVYVVNVQNQIEERSVKVGVETADRYEVLAGLHEGDRVMIGTRFVVQPGETVSPVVKPAPGEEPTAR